MIFVDTFEIGDSKCSPKGDLVIIGMEILGGKIAGHEYAYVVDSASPDSIRDFWLYRYCPWMRGMAAS